MFSVKFVAQKTQELTNYLGVWEGFKSFWSALAQAQPLRQAKVAIIGPSEVRALPMRRSTRAAWQM